MHSDFSLNTYSYTLTMSAKSCLQHLQKLGGREFELMIYPGHVWIDTDQATLRDIRSMVAGEGLRFSSVNTVNVDLNISAASAEMRAHSLGLVEAFIQIAGRLGVPSFILGPGKPNPLLAAPFEQMREHFFSALDRLLPVARSNGVQLWVENMPFAFLPDLDRLLATLDLYGHSEIGICYDAANAHFIGEDPAAGVRRLGQRLDLLHISDTTRRTYLHAGIGVGDVNFAALGEAVRETGLKRQPVLEIISRNGDKDLFEAPYLLRQRGYFG